MSGGSACRCKPRNAEVVNRECHFSAFAGYRRTRSKYSRVRCRECGACWRTKAAWVKAAPDATARQLSMDADFENDLRDNGGVAGLAELLTSVVSVNQGVQREQG